VEKTPPASNFKKTIPTSLPARTVILRLVLHDAVFRPALSLGEFGLRHMLRSSLDVIVDRVERRIDDCEPHVRLQIVSVSTDRHPINGSAALL
jgi:hypothetical protein